MHNKSTRRIPHLGSVALLTGGLLVFMGLAAPRAHAEPIRVKVNAVHQDGSHLKVNVEGDALGALSGTARLTTTNPNTGLRAVHELIIVSSFLSFCQECTGFGDEYLIVLSDPGGGFVRIVLQLRTDGKPAILFVPFPGRIFCDPAEDQGSFCFNIEGPVGVDNDADLVIRITLP